MFLVICGAVGVDVAVVALGVAVVGGVAVAVVGGVAVAVVCLLLLLVVPTIAIITNTFAVDC